MTKDATILVIGSANADFVIHTDKMPVLGETRHGSGFAVNAGGKGLNQAVAIAKLGGDTAFVGAIGQDPNGSALLDALSDAHVPFLGVSLPEHTTGVAMITVVNGDNFILLHDGANQALTPERIEEKADLIREADFLVLQLETPMESVACACRIAKSHGTQTVLNPAPYRPLPEQLLTMVDFLIPNEHEAQALTGIYPDTPEACTKAIQALQGMGAKNIVITLGERGCVYTHNDEICFCPAQPANVVDTTSAGDSFIGAFVTALSKGRSIPDAIRIGTSVAAITISRPGAASSIPFAHELKEKLL